MKFAHVIGVVLLVALAGCAGLGEAASESTVDLVVQNEGTAPLAVAVVVTDADGTVVAEETEQLDASVGRTFEVTLSGVGTHEVLVSGTDWAAGTRIDPAACETHETTIRVSDERVANVGECLALR
jgi:plastocyanin